MFDIKESAGKVKWRYEPAIKHTSSVCLCVVVKIGVHGSVPREGNGPPGPWRGSVDQGSIFLYSFFLSTKVVKNQSLHTA